MQVPDTVEAGMWQAYTVSGQEPDEFFASFKIDEIPRVAVGTFEAGSDALRSPTTRDVKIAYMKLGSYLVSLTDC